MFTKNHKTIFSNANGYTSFIYGGRYIRFLVPYSLERYVDVVSRDDGSLVVNKTVQIACS